MRDTLRGETGPNTQRETQRKANTQKEKERKQQQGLESTGPNLEEGDCF